MGSCVWSSIILHNSPELPRKVIDLWLEIRGSLRLQTDRTATVNYAKKRGMLVQVVSSVPSAVLYFSGLSVNNVRYSSPMTSVGSDEPEFQRVLDALGLVFSAKTGKADPVIDALSAVVMSDIQHDAVFSALKQKPANMMSSGYDTRSPSSNVPCRNIPDQKFSAAPAPPSGRCVHLCDRGDPLRVPRDGAYCCNVSACVVDPYLALRD